MAKLPCQSSLVTTACVLLLSITRLGGASKLLLYPVNIQSHIAYFGRLGSILVQEGHDVTLLLASNANTAQLLQYMSPNITTMVYGVDTQVQYTTTQRCTKLSADIASSSYQWERVKKFGTLAEELQENARSECINLLENTKLIEELDHKNFNLAIVDAIGFNCHFVLPHRLNISYAASSIPMMPWRTNVPALHSFVPSLLSSFGPRMDFTERLSNVLFDLVTYNMMDSRTDLMERFAPHSPALVPNDLLKGAIFWFWYRDETLSYPQPAMPNSIDIGSIMCREPTEAVPEHIQTFIDGALNGLVVVSFGSFLRHLEDNVAEHMCEAFLKMNLRVLWKTSFSNHLCNSMGTENVLTVNWMPQNAVLNHPNTKLFITHCGLGSLIEGICHAVPLLGIPVMLDQHFNARVIEERQYGNLLNVNDVTPETLFNVIKETLSDVSILSNVRKASKIMKNKPVPPAKLISYWIKRLQLDGGKDLESSAENLTFFEFYMIDIILFVMICVCLITFIVISLSNRLGKHLNDFRLTFCMND